jgi:Bacterial archaeo-eukaryotic release factor family 3
MNISAEPLTYNTLLRLVAVTTPPCVSLVFPQEHGKWDERQARLELKNLIAIARDRLDPVRHSLETDELLAPAEALLAEGARRSGHGIAMFLSRATSLIVELPGPAGPLVSVGDRFDVLPLLRLVMPDRAYHVLTLSRNHVALYRGSRHTFERIHHPDLPTSLDDELWYEQHENMLISHGGERHGSSSQPSVVVHGGQAWQDEKKDMFERYFQHINKAVEAIIHDPTKPLVLAAVERELSGYREVSKSKAITQKSIVGNPDEVTPEELHRLSWSIVHDETEAASRTLMLNRFGDATGTARQSIDPDDIIMAAATGRVDALLLAEAPEEVHDIPRTGGGVEGFLNEIVTNTLLHSGSVTFVPAASLPDNAAAGALLRWA